MLRFKSKHFTHSESIYATLWHRVRRDGRTPSGCFVSVLVSYSQLLAACHTVAFLKCAALIMLPR